MAKTPKFQPAAFASNLVLRGLIGALLAVPYRWRIPMAGWVVSRLIAPIAGWDKRVRDNLALIFPDMPAAEVARLTRAVPNNAGRTLVELYSGAEFKARVAQTPVTGAGLDAILQARKAGQGVILVSGHFGNYDVPRAVLSAQGHLVGGLYQPMKNPYFNAHYVRTITAIGTPMFARGRRGLAEMVQHLRAGGLMGMLIDQSMEHGAALTFFGKRALTALSAAELALKYNCLLVPIYAVRQPDGLSFELVIEAPITPDTPEAMTQALNDSLEAIARKHLDQWFWIHRRWK
jgi:KDO2-lipid IV(A) lauroyltransferase